MKRALMAIISLASLAGILANTPAYYVLEKIVENGVQQPASGSGIYVAFGNGVCYDADSEGYTNNNSLQNFVYSHNGINVYNGTTYWGSGEYRFNSDYSRLNIAVGEKIYVYQRSGQPASARQSTYIGQPATRSTGVVEPVMTGMPAQMPTPLNAHPDAAWYQQTYNRMAENARQVYDSIVTRVRDTRGNEYSGYIYDRSDSQVAIMGMMQIYRGYQRDMRDLRSEASRHGYSLVQSPYETQEISIGSLRLTN